MWQKVIDGQYRRPSGLLGRWIGRKMAQQHIPENMWTVNLLDAQPNQHILEIGFGPGIAIEQAAKRFPSCKITGVDFSQTMVKVASQRNAEGIQAGRVNLRFGDVLHLPFGDATFDRVYSIHSIYFWPRPVEALKEVYRVMKTSGILILTILPKEKWGDGDPNKPIGTPECRPYSAPELETILSEIGFSTIRIAADTPEASPSNYSVMATRP